MGLDTCLIQASWLMDIRNIKKQHLAFQFWDENLKKHIMLHSMEKQTNAAEMCTPDVAMIMPRNSQIGCIKLLFYKKYGK